MIPNSVYLDSDMKIINKDCMKSLQCNGISTEKMYFHFKKQCVIVFVSRHDTTNVVYFELYISFG